MKKWYWIVVVVLLFGLVPWAGAGEGAPQSVTQVYFVEVAPSQANQFEAATKSHMAWHRTNNDPWTWQMWQFVNGERVGQYAVATGGHTWADFDTRAVFEQKDVADWTAKVGPYVKGLRSALEVDNKEISRLPKDMKTPKMVEVTVFKLKHARWRAFYHAVEKIHKAIVKKDAPYFYAWRTVANGGESPTMILFVPRNSWAEFEPKGSFWSMVEEVYGDFETNVIRKTIGKAIRSEESLVAAYRPDLSYVPAK